MDSPLELATGAVGTALAVGLPLQLAGLELGRPRCPSAAPPLPLSLSLALPPLPALLSEVAGEVVELLVVLFVNFRPLFVELSRVLALVLAVLLLELGVLLLLCLRLPS